MSSGLINIGSTCYMNSCLQCLCHIPELRDYFIKNISDGEKQYSSNYNLQHKYFHPNRTQVLKKLGDEFQKLISALNNSTDTRPIEPRSFRSSLAVFKPVFKTSQQQDAHECIILILDKLHESIKMQVSININGTIRTSFDKRKKYAFDQYKAFLGKNGYSEINKLFYGQFESTITCKGCGNTSFRYDPYCSLEVEIPNGGNSLYDCLDDYCFRELLQGEDSYNCEKCKCKQEATKMLQIWTLPKILIIQLKRFNFMLRKNNAHIQCPRKLNMNKYVTHPASIASGSDQGGIQMYNLISTIEHSGNLRGGHYIAKCNIGQTTPNSNSWMIFNDASVHRMDPSKVITPNTYLLIYKMDEHTEKVWNKH
jgi:ubiquitin carboxyl-terminal hydrolase 8